VRQRWWPSYLDTSRGPMGFSLIFGEVFGERWGQTGVPDFGPPRRRRVGCGTKWGTRDMQPGRPRSPHLHCCRAPEPVSETLTWVETGLPMARFDW
jgi:hypothetical protein